MDHPPAHDHTQEEAESRSHQSQDGRLPQHQPQDLPPGHAQGAEAPQDGPPLHHREGHGVVDEEHPEDEGQEAQGREIQVEGPDHLREAGRAASRPHHLHAGTESLPELVLAGTRSRLVQNEIDAGEPPFHPQEFLGPAHVHDQDVPDAPPGDLVPGGEDAGDPQADVPPVHLDPEGPAHGGVQVGGELPPHEDASAGGQEVGDVHPLRPAQEVGPEGTLGEGIHPQDAKGTGGKGRRGDESLHHRGRGPDPGLQAEDGEEGVRDPRTVSQHLVRGPAGHRFGGYPEGFPGALDGQVDGDHDPNPHGYPQHGENDLPGVLQEEAGAGPGEERLHGSAPARSDLAGATASIRGHPPPGARFRCVGPGPPRRRSPGCGWPPGG